MRSIDVKGGEVSGQKRLENKGFSKEVFEALQIEKRRRSTVIKDEDGSQRKDKKYSSK